MKKLKRGEVWDMGRGDKIYRQIIYEVYKNIYKFSYGVMMVLYLVGQVGKGTG